MEYLSIQNSFKESHQNVQNEYQSSPCSMEIKALACTVSRDKHVDAFLNQSLPVVSVRTLVVVSSARSITSQWIQV